MNVCPMNSGGIVLRRDQVLIGFFVPALISRATFSSRWSSMNGPFFVLRPMDQCGPFLRRRRMNLLVGFFLLRVRPPLASTALGEQGWRPPAVRPSPPPIG